MINTTLNTSVLTGVKYRAFKKCGVVQFLSYKHFLTFPQIHNLTLQNKNTVLNDKLFVINGLEYVHLYFNSILHFKASETLFNMCELLLISSISSVICLSSSIHYYCNDRIFEIWT